MDVGRKQRAGVRRAEGRGGRPGVGDMRRATLGSSSSEALTFLARGCRSVSREITVSAVDP